MRMSEHFVRFGFADWQFYPIVLSVYIPAIYFLGGTFGAWEFGFIGFCVGATVFRFIENYFDWGLEKIKEKQKVVVERRLCVGGRE